MTQPAVRRTAATSWIRGGSAVFLVLVTVALIVALNLWTMSPWLRVAVLVGACLTIVAVVFLLPPGLRTKLGAPTAVFVAAAGTVSIFIVSPGSPAPEPPRLDVRQLAQYVEAGPLDQKVPPGLSVGDPRHADSGHAAGSVTSVEFPITSPEHTIYTFVEVYSTPAAAAARARADMKFLKENYISPARPQTIDGFCFLITPDAWECGGVRGHAYANTTLSPGANYTLPVAVDLTAALLRYTDNKAKLATHPA